MFIKPLRSMVGSYGHIRKGIVAKIDDRVAVQLVKKGLAVPAKPSDSKKGAAGKADSHPSKAKQANAGAGGQSGGRTGAEKR